MSQPRLIPSFTLTLVLAVLAPLGAHAQSNAPLTGNMSGGAQAAPQPAPLPAATLPDRPVVQQVPSAMPQAEAPAAQPGTAQATQQAAPAPAAAEAREGFGDVTRGLLAAQADGRRAGGVLPILGPVSSAAWNRYVDSFKQPIPEWFQKRVETKNTN
ncbi:DUF3613 domain-containing protein [Achromobacter pestifer]|uniref:DUF3613 domain-containing protein n=1 Tax=Achromobacter pestifer TaxID=1353889 RepID=A0A6S6ZBM4_9BURK|nr:DUF3613 domain-containing protein [Achromobacter pestifer]CAB3637229.1 hypothetical protein LMG3431_01734 [Achromobacter pestifer]